MLGLKVCAITTLVDPYFVNHYPFSFSCAASGSAGVGLGLGSVLLEKRKVRGNSRRQQHLSHSNNGINGKRGRRLLEGLQRLLQVAFLVSVTKGEGRGPEQVTVTRKKDV